MLNNLDSDSVHILLHEMVWSSKLMHDIVLTSPVGPHLWTG
jgi:hypothetical protein